MQDDLKNCPKISIITVSYNSAKTIEQTILSVINQSYKNIEYIIIDGGSTDGTVDIIKKYADKIAYWVSEPDKGISDAFNKGIKKSTGEIVGIINADDWYELDAIKLIVEIFAIEKEYGFCFGDLVYTDDNNQICMKQFGRKEYEESIRYEMKDIPHPTVFIRREIYEKVGLFSLNFKIAMDYELMLRISKNKIKGLYISKTIANMRIGGVSNVNWKDGLKEVRRASISMGANVLLANYKYIIKKMRVETKKILLSMGLDDLVIKLRNKFRKESNIEYYK